MCALFIPIVWFTFQYNVIHYARYFQVFYWVLTLSVSLCSTLRYTQVFSLRLKRNNSQTFRSRSCEKHFLQCACYRQNLLRVMFFIPFDNWKSCFFVKVWRYLRFFSLHFVAFFEAKGLKEVRILCHVHNISANTKVSK